MRAFLLTVVTTLAIAAGKVHAQRPDSPRVPQPISVTELQRYGDILGLSDGQRLAVEAAYDDYLDEFDPLRREMIEDHLLRDGFSRLLFVSSCHGSVANCVDLAVIESRELQSKRSRRFYCLCSGQNVNILNPMTACWGMKGNGA